MTREESEKYIKSKMCSDFGFQKMSDAYCKYCGAKMKSEKSER